MVQCDGKQGRPGGKLGSRRCYCCHEETGSLEVLQGMAHRRASHVAGGGGGCSSTSKLTIDILPVFSANCHPARLASPALLGRVWAVPCDSEKVRTKAQR